MVQVGHVAAPARSFQPIEFNKFLRELTVLGKKKTSSKQILILGLGGVGLYLAKRLVHEGYAVTAIESESQLIQLADGVVDARLIHGTGMSLKCWKEAEAQKMDFLIAVTDNDAVNMLAALIADRFGITNKISRVRSLEFGQEGTIFGAKDLKIDLVIHPEELAAQEIVRLIKRTAGNEIIDIAQGEMQLVATRIHNDSPLAHKTLMEISKTYNHFPFRVVAVARGITTVIPGGEHELVPQDQVFIMASRKDLPQLMALTGMSQQRRYRVMILGGGAVGSRVAELLGKTVRVKIVEKDIKRAEELTFRLKHAEVLHGDGSEAGVLEMAGLLDMDTFISATGENETNIMSSMLAKQLMAARNGRDVTKTAARPFHW